ncbi:MAG TPA: sugar phosphate isomerase/epimerase, partial [Actinobacteria bacterium]|nr:sugar phosphate isomerase/epimerase [Actinomycetes bacterium]HEX21661.1 sugar phosphate isomerase/epimerase [Actinomycetota bacterium]
MKISFCSIAFRKSPKTILEIIPIIADLGYDAIEIWGNHFNDIPLADIKDA